MNIYTFNGETINHEFHDKLVKENYIIKKITIYFDNEIDISYKNCFIFYSNHSIEYFKNTFEYYNNKLSFNCHVDVSVETITKQFSITLNRKKIKYKYIEAEIYKPKIYIYRIENDILLDNNDDLIIRSDYFKNFDELILYIMDISGLNYELSKEYLTYYGGQYSYNINIDTEYYDEIIIFNGKALNIDPSLE